VCKAEDCQHLAGTEIDYDSGFTGTGFVFRNPNTKGCTGCGASFPT